jgi:hypothetical protein
MRSVCSVAGVAALHLWSVVAHAEPQDVVNGVYCNYDGIVNLFEITKDRRATVAELQTMVASETCFAAPTVPVEITAVIGAKAKDYEGDWMTIVQVGDNVYTVAWYGKNTSLAAPASFSI